MGLAESVHCPTCKAPFRGAVRCSRCGSDLTLLVKVAAAAALTAKKARTALFDGDFPLVRELAGQAIALRSTASTRRLFVLARWLGSDAGSSG